MDRSVKCQNKAPHVVKLKRFQVLKVFPEMKFCTPYIKVSDFLSSQSIFSKSRLYRFRDLKCRDRYNRRKGCRSGGITGNDVYSGKNGQAPNVRYNGGFRYYGRCL